MFSANGAQIGSMFSLLFSVKTASAMSDTDFCGVDLAMALIAFSFDNVKLRTSSSEA